MIKRALILIAVNIALMFGGATLLDRLGYGDSPLRFVWFVLVGGLTGILFARTSPPGPVKRRR